MSSGCFEVNIEDGQRLLIHVTLNFTLASLSDVTTPSRSSNSICSKGQSRTSGAQNDVAVINSRENSTHQDSIIAQLAEEHVAEESAEERPDQTPQEHAAQGHSSVVHDYITRLEIE